MQSIKVKHLNTPLIKHAEQDNIINQKQKSKNSGQENNVYKIKLLEPTYILMNNKSIIYNTNN